MANGRSNFIFGSLKFIEENFIEIILVSICFFLLVSYLILNNVEFPSDKAHVERVVIMETMTSKDGGDDALKQIRSKQKFKEELKKSFCSKTKESLNPHQLEKEMTKENNKCKALGSKGVCTNSLCCVWAESKKGKGICLGGDKSGPTKNPPNMKIDEYYYLENKYQV